MTKSMKMALAGTTALIALSGAAFADGHAMTIGITQHNVRVDSYQTTYEQAFIDAAETNDAVKALSSTTLQPPTNRAY